MAKKKQPAKNTGNRSPEFLRALARKNQHILEARNDVNCFVEYCLTDDKGRPIKQGDIHREWQALGDRYERLMIIGPKAHGKSMQSLARVLYKLGRNKNELIKLLCASDSKGMKRMSLIRHNIEHNDILHRVFPHLHMRGVRAINKKHLYLERPGVSSEPSVEAKGITSSATGDRATGLVADDAVDYRNSVMQPKMRESIKGAWGDWYSLLTPGGWMYWISNLWHNLDLTHDLMANPEYHVAMYEINPDTFGSVVRLPDGRVRESDEPLWPELWGKKELAKHKKIHKAHGFARLFSLRPMSELGQKIDGDWIRPWTEPPGDDWWRLMILDLAESETMRADFTGVVELAISPDTPQIKIVDAYHQKIDFTGKVQLIRTEHQTKRFSDIALEKSAGAISLFQHMTSNYRLPMRLIPLEGRSKKIWLDMATPYLKAGVVEFNPWLIDNTGQLGERGDLVAEMKGFGSYPTDDILDALTRGIYYATVVYSVFDDISDLQPPDGADGDVSVASFSDDEEDFEVILI